MARRFMTSTAFSHVMVYIAFALLLEVLMPGAAYSAGDSTATAGSVWGQASFVSVDHRCTHPTSMALCGPTQAAPDAEGNLWVTDLIHNRVLMFPPGSAIASQVFGQYGSMTTRGCDQAPLGS